MIKYGNRAPALAIAAALIATLPGLARAEDYVSPTNDRVRVSIGIMHPSTSTTLRVDSSTGMPGTVVSGEDDLGLEKSDIEPKFQVMVRAGERNRVRLDYFTLDRTGNTVLTKPIVFRDSVLQVGDPVQSKLDLRILGLAYGYSFWHGEKLEIAGTLAINSVQIAVEAKVQSANRHVFQTQDIAGPFPTPGIDATWVASSRFYLDARAQYLNVHVHELTGSLSIFEFDALYRFRPNVSFALGYSSVKEHLESQKSTSGGFFNVNSKGPEFFVRIAF